MRFYTQKRKERAKQEASERASERGKQGMQAFRQAGKVASWSVGSRALVVSAAKGRNREGGMGEGEKERGRRSGYHRKMEP